MEYADQYKQVQSVKSESMLRHLVLSYLATFYKVTGQISSSAKRNRVQFLYLHHLFKDEEESFRNMLRILSRGNHFINYSEAVDRIMNGEIDKPYIAVSFDDGLKNSLSAAKIMDEFGIRACFFLCTSMVGETDYQKIKKLCFQIRMPTTEFMSWGDVEALVKKGHEIGGHTATHPNLAQLSVPEIEAEITESFDVLAKRLGCVKHFAWPLGRFSHFSPDAARIVFAARYQSCASAERGCHVSPQPERKRSSLCIRRDHIIARWPVNHILYFIAKNSRLSSIRSNQWPTGWREIIERVN